MVGNLFLALSTFAWLGLVAFNLQRINASGQQLMGWGLIGFGLLAVYGLCSGVLTLRIAATGGFDWLAEAPLVRHVMVGLGWVCMTTGVVYCTMLRMEWQADQPASLVRWLTMPVYFGALWLPLLMLVPYALLLNPAWRGNLSPLVFRIPLAAGCSAGLAIYLASQLVARTATSEPADKSRLDYERSVDIINRYETSQLWGFTRRGVDERVRALALAKIKANPAWEAEMQQALDGNTGFLDVYAYLDGNAFDHPERFVGPVARNISQFAYLIRDAIATPRREAEYFRTLDAERLCRVLDEHFRDSGAAFRPGMLELQTALETPPLDRFADIRESYRRALARWLDSH